MANKTTRRVPPAERRAAAAERRRIQEARERRRRIFTVGAIVVVVVAIVAAVTAGVVLQRRSATQQSAIPGVQSFTEDRGHVNGPVTYPQTPPAGGPHNPVWQNCGIYDQPVPNVNAVHSLEHGAVWITYQPSLPAAEVDQLRSRVRGQSYLLLSPYAGLPSPVVVSAWGKQLRLNSPTDSRLAAFLAAYRAKGPEPGAACDGGTGTPLQ